VIRGQLSVSSRTGAHGTFGPGQEKVAAAANRSAASQASRCVIEPPHETPVAWIRSLDLVRGTNRRDHPADEADLVKGRVPGVAVDVYHQRDSDTAVVAGWNQHIVGSHDSLMRERQPRVQAGRPIRARICCMNDACQHGQRYEQ
jgi:hypothetical protein